MTHIHSTFGIWRCSSTAIWRLCCVESNGTQQSGANHHKLTTLAIEWANRLDHIKKREERALYKWRVPSTTICVYHFGLPKFSYKSNSNVFIRVTCPQLVDNAIRWIIHRHCSDSHSTPELAWTIYTKRQCHHRYRCPSWHSIRHGIITPRRRSSFIIGWWFWVALVLVSFWIHIFSPNLINSSNWVT